MSIVVYGIKNCNTVKSALQWLHENKVVFQFHDFKAKGIDVSKLKQWVDQAGWENLINKRGTTWRQLGPGLQEKIITETAAIALMKEKTSVIKRPLIESNKKIIALGFDPEVYKRLFNE